MSTRYLKRFTRFIGIYILISSISYSISYNLIYFEVRVGTIFILSGFDDTENYVYIYIIMVIIIMHMPQTTTERLLCFSAIERAHKLSILL